MVTRFTNLLEKRNRILRDIETNPKRTHPKYIADMTLGLKKVNWQIANFGCREKIIKVDVEFWQDAPFRDLPKHPIEPAPFKSKTTIFYTGITQSDAVEVIRNGFGNRLIKVEAVEIPVGKPISMVNL